MSDLNKISQLENQCKNLCTEIKAISDSYFKIGIKNDLISKEVRRLSSRAKEYEHGAFIAIVVGPAKSGKSTLVNLIAGAFVSPTNFLECTVRPSIISRKGNDENSEITCYTSDNGEDKIEKIDSIIDCIRGLENETDLQDIRIEKFPLTPELIRTKVELGLEESLTSDTLVTSIKTPGGNLLQDNIFLIDMPGFDGAYKNIDDPTYDVIAQRADLIIFVQSSNAAFSKVSKDFLNTLFTSNKDVPVCLIHNQFDASWWKSKEEKDKQTDSQRKFAFNEIRKSGFNIADENCYTLNLGAVQDFRSGKYPGNKMMDDEVQKFSIAEKELYERIVNRKDAIRLDNCVRRTFQQARRLVELIDSEISKRKAIIVEYQRVRDLFHSIDDRVVYDVDISLNIAQINMVFDQHEHQALEEYSNDSIKYGNQDTIERLKKFTDRLNDGFNDNLGAILNVSLHENSIHNCFRDKASNIRETLIGGLSSLVPDIPAGKIEIGPTGNADLHSFIDLDTIVPVRRRFMVLSGRHSAEDMRNYIINIVDRLTTMKDHNGQPTNYGYVFHEVLPAIKNRINQRLNEIKLEYQKRLTDYLDSTCAERLSALTPDYDSYVARTGELMSLSQRLHKICK